MRKNGFDCSGFLRLNFNKKGQVVPTKIIDGKAIAVQVRAELKIEAMKWREQGIIPNLAAIQAGDDAASLVYVRSKQRLCQQVGINLDLFTFKSVMGHGEFMNPYIPIF